MFVYPFHTPILIWESLMRGISNQLRNRMLLYQVYIHSLNTLACDELIINNMHNNCAQLFEVMIRVVEINFRVNIHSTLILGNVDGNGSEYQ
jgi:hypothetical protein